MDIFAAATNFVWTQCVLISEADPVKTGRVSAVKSY